MSQPHILVIVSDQHRRDFLGAASETWQHDLVETPNLDALSQRGVRFAQTWCPYPLCGPSRMSFMTGRASSRIGMYVNEHTLRSDVPTFAHALGRAGYETVLCGRMHFSGIDQRHGFEKRLVGDMNAGCGGGKSVDRMRSPKESSNSFFAASQAGTGDSTSLHFDGSVKDAACRFMQERDDERPLMMVAGFFLPHHPFTAPGDYVERARKRLEAHDRGPVETEWEHPVVCEHIENRSKDHPTPEQITEARVNYAAMVDYMDVLIGEMLETAERELNGPVVVVYTSDHGEMLGDHGLWGKTLAHEASVGIPMIFSSLRGEDSESLGIRSGVVVYSPTSLLDVAPTVASLGGAPTITGLDGWNLTPLLRDGSNDSQQWAERPVFAEMCLRFPGPDGRLAINEPATRIVRHGDYKLTYYHQENRDWGDASDVTLYNLAEDPDETKDLALLPDYASIRNELMNLILLDWNPDLVSADANQRACDLAYVTAWMREEGLRQIGPLEVYDIDQPVFNFPAIGRRGNNL